ncbi:MAG TPA: hypothetical protein VIZ68_03265, partial [Thermoplasmata archaeon]
MSCTVELLAVVARDVEGQVRSQLQGMFGPMIRSYLPQTWVFTTEEGSASLTVDAEGRATATPGALPNADVTVVTSHARLEAALRTRRKEAVPPGPLTV